MTLSAGPAIGEVERWDDRTKKLKKHEGCWKQESKDQKNTRQEFTFL
tara:strand:- start:103 stop:243 length:141 start_codon:yes stop_codon:yes gene_type:complete